jgi:BirA family biotin operon repressor/biotin-[acetyl-CoA-carboxylase] ligase
MLDENRLRAGLPIHGLGEPLHCYASLGSTNDRALELARGGEPAGTLVLADEQTAGRGRMGRTWRTPRGSALALSLILRPTGIPALRLGPLNALGALGVVEGLKNMGLSAQIKWPNDVLLEGRKTAGVLVEASWEGERLEFVVLGVGVNVSAASVPPLGEIDYPATCVEEAAACDVEREALVLQIVAGIGRWFPRLPDLAFHTAWQHSLAFLGQAVCLTTPDGEVVGQLAGLTVDGRVRLRTGEGQILLIGGEATSLRPVDSQA